MTLAPFRYLLWLLIAFIVTAAITLLPGVLKITGHEVDLMQTLDISYRILEGERPHIDFMTPLGVLSFLPISFFLGLGYGPGMSFLLAQFLACAIALPAIWWVGMSRLDGTLRLVYGVSMVLLATSLIFGGANPSITAGMYYNRWAWVLAGFVILMIFLPPRRGWSSALVDGLILGLSGAALVLIKVTFAISLIPLVLVWALQARPWSRILIGVSAALGALAAATVLFGGLEFWQRYVADLIAVAAGESRPNPGVGLGELLAGPAYLPITLILGTVVILWRKVRLDQAGLLLLVAAPGFVYITFQNWGNDPKWLFFLAILLIALRPPEAAKSFLGLPALHATRVVAVLCLFLFAPSLITISTSHVRHLGLASGDYVPIFSDERMKDILADPQRVYVPEVKRPFAGTILVPDDVELPDQGKAAVLNGEELETCSLRLGLIGWTETVVEQLGAVEEAVARPIIVADIYDHLWMFGPFPRSPGMAPWYYGTSDGFDDAEYILVPLCPVSPWSRRTKLSVMEEKGWILEEVIRTDLFILVRRAG